MSANLIIEVWDNIKPHINSRDRLTVADTLISLFDDYGYADGIEDAPGLDKILAAAVASHYYDSDLDEDEDDEHTNW